MHDTTKRATIYFDPIMHDALRLKSVHSQRSISDLVNDAVRAALEEDREDLAAFDQPAIEPEVTPRQFHCR